MRNTAYKGGSIYLEYDNEVDLVGDSIYNTTKCNNGDYINFRIRNFKINESSSFYDGGFAFFKGINCKLNLTTSFNTIENVASNSNSELITENDKAYDDTIEGGGFLKILANALNATLIYNDFKKINSTIANGGLFLFDARDKMTLYIYENKISTISALKKG